MSATPSPGFLRKAERMAQSAATPDFADLRSRALKTIHRALGDHARPLGYRATRSGWEMPALSGTARVRIRHGGGGAACAINLDPDAAALPDALDLPMQVFSRRALPRLEACGERGARRPLDPFIPTTAESRKAPGADP